MLKKMFPDCPIPNKSGMIKKRSHTINIASKPILVKTGQAAGIVRSVNLIPG
jgi:hypothetical protein